MFFTHYFSFNDHFFFNDYFYSLNSLSYVSTWPASLRKPEFCDPPEFPFSLYVREYPSYLDASHFMDMQASDRLLTVRDRHSVLCDTDVGALVKHWLQCGGHGLSGLR